MRHAFRFLFATALLFISTGQNANALTYTPGYIYTVAGTGESGYSGDSGIATQSKINFPFGVAVDTGGNLYFADAGNNIVRKVGANGMMTSVAAGKYSQAVATDGVGNLYTSDIDDTIRKITPSGIITIVAGTGVRGGYSGDNGPATSAQLYAPGGIVVDSVGNLYFADCNNHRIRKVTPGGTITTVAGTGVAGYFGDNGPATSAQLNSPGFVAIDGAGNLYFSDTYNNRIRKIATNGTITTVAGSGVKGYSGNNGLATSAQIGAPTGIAVDGAGTLYFADSDNNCIRKVATNGIITTIAGAARVLNSSGDNGPAATAQIAIPFGVAVDGMGNLYFAEVALVPVKISRVRMIVGIASGQSAGTSPTPTGTTSDSDRIFGYLESKYPQYLAPAKAVSVTDPTYYYRYYSTTKSYIATSNGQLFYLGPAFGNGNPMPLGAMTEWLATIRKDGF